MHCSHNKKTSNKNRKMKIEFRTHTESSKIQFRFNDVTVHINTVVRIFGSDRCYFHRTTIQLATPAVVLFSHYIGRTRLRTHWEHRTPYANDVYGGSMLPTGSIEVCVCVCVCVCIVQFQQCSSRSHTRSLARSFTLCVCFATLHTILHTHTRSRSDADSHTYSERTGRAHMRSRPATYVASSPLGMFLEKLN